MAAETVVTLSVAIVFLYRMDYFLQILLEIFLKENKH